MHMAVKIYKNYTKICSIKLQICIKCTEKGKHVEKLCKILCKIENKILVLF